MKDAGVPTVVFAGDSITASADWQAWLPGIHTVNLAVPGHTTADLLAMTPHVVAAQPDLIVILIGTNDFGGLGREPSDVARDIAGIVESLCAAAPRATVLLQSVMPRGEYWTPAVRELNSQLDAAAQTLGVGYLDTWRALARADGSGLDPVYLLEDGFDVHLNDAGYRAWLDVLRPAITSCLEEGSDPRGQRQ
jgi:N-acetylglucosamine-6-sulfatase